MSFSVQNAAGQPLMSIEALEAEAARHRPKSVLPRWLRHRPWPLGFVAAIERARDSNDRDALRPLYKQARKVLKAEKRGETERVAQLLQALRDAHDPGEFTITVLDPDDPVARSINDGTFDRAAHIRAVEARFGEPVLAVYPPLEGWPSG